MTHLIYTPSFISTSSNGMWVLVTATADPGQIIHTVQVTGTDEREEIRLSAYNAAATSAEPLSILWGSTDASSLFPNVTVQTAGAGPQVIIGLNPLSATTSSIRVWTTGTATTGSIRIIGGVNRATDAG